MCFFNHSNDSGSVAAPAETYNSQSTTAATEEKKETAKAKARLLETQGANKGAELNAQQGRSVRRIFG